MINANELRIGNWTHRKTHNGQHVCFERVEYLDKKGYGNLPSSECFPIPLTPEILEKCGFDVQEYDATLRKNGFTLSFEFNGEDAGFYLESVGINLMHLHQLQNLYFALTQTELLIKL